MTDPTSIIIDGSQGEGGGQMLRSSLALSMATGRPFRMINVRAARPKPGLMRQHLTCVQAAAAICGATVTGADIGSREVTFAPGLVRAGDYHFAIGTAGSCTMVLQAILPPLLRLDRPSTITVEGGTHNGMAPPFEFFERALLPLLRRAGACVVARLDRHGFYPAGGGRIIVEVQPPASLTPLHLSSRGERRGATAWAIISRLSRSIAVRELRALSDRLGLSEGEAHIVVTQDSVGPGNAVVVALEYEHVTEVFSSVGEIGKSAELVAREAADEARDYIASQVPVGPHLADQLMVPLALLSGGQYATCALTEHATTNMFLLRAFGATIDFSATGTISIDPLQQARPAMHTQSLLAHDVE